MINVLGLVDKINQLNDKINELLGDKFGNISFRVIVLVILVVIIVFSINEFNKN